MSLACVVYFIFSLVWQESKKQITGAASITIAGLEVDEIFHSVQEHGSTSLVLTSIMNLQ